MADELETYPAAPTRGGGANVPMPDQDEDLSESSADYEQESVDSETATPQEAIEDQDAQDEESVPFHEHPRWKEREQEWNAKLQRMEREAEEARTLARSVIDKFQGPQQTAPVQEDPWKGLVDHPDPATAQWYQDLRARTERTVDSIVERKMQNVMQAVDAGRTELASIKIAQFRKENPDIKPGSDEEKRVIYGLNQGYDLETSRKLALFETYEHQLKELKGKRNAIPKKAAANNAESNAGIPNRSGLPQRASSWKDKASEAYDKSGGDARSVFNSIFGGRR